MVHQKILIHELLVMFGEMAPPDEDTEHSVVPILKLIDFGSMTMLAGSLSVRPASRILSPVN